MQIKNGKPKINEMNIKNIWNDPVWSKVISSIILLMMASGYALIKSYLDNVSFIDVIQTFGGVQIKLWLIVLIVVILLVGYGIYSKFFDNRHFRYDSHTYNNDKELYDNFTKDLPPDGSIYFLRTNNFAGFSFHLSSLDELKHFYYKYSNDPRIEFFHPELEQMRKQLMADIDKFDDLICINTFPGVRDDLQIVPPEWEEENPKRFWAVVDSIHAAAKQVCTDYDEFVKLGRRLIRL